MRLENWSIVIRNFDPYKAPELLGQYLHGEVYDSVRFKDGSRITTSRIVGVYGELIETKSGNRYELGIIDSEYEKLYPDAKNRLLKSLKDNVS
jgi:hypothetical protein